MNNNHPLTLNGWLLIDKPLKITSTQVVTKLKYLFKQNNYKVTKIGHGGTLDPLATGALPIALGEATKTNDYIMAKFKTYYFTLQFGMLTTTLDSEGKVIEQNDVMPTKEQLLEASSKFVGKIQQTPPNFSAIKVNGKRAYALARKNETFLIPSREVIVRELQLLNYNSAAKQAAFKAEVSKGTYVRSLGTDLALSVNSLAYISNLRRTSIKGFKESALLQLDSLYNNVKLAVDHLLTIEEVLDDIPSIILNPSEARAISQGKSLAVSNLNFTNDSCGKESNNCLKGTYKAICAGKIISLLAIENNVTKVLRNFNW